MEESIATTNDLMEALGCKTKKYAQLLTDEERTQVESFCKEGAVEEWEPDSRLFGHSWFIEVPIVFAHPEFIEGRQYDETFSKTMRKMWVQFAKTGNPSLTAEQSTDGKANMKADKII